MLLRLKDGWIDDILSVSGVNKWDDSYIEEIDFKLKKETFCIVLVNSCSFESKLSSLLKLIILDYEELSNMNEKCARLEITEICKRKFSEYIVKWYIRG